LVFIFTMADPGSISIDNVSLANIKSPPLGTGIGPDMIGPVPPSPLKDTLKLGPVLPGPVGPVTTL
jgi:hypothetical protein